MRVGLLIEQFLAKRGRATVSELSGEFALSRERIREEVAELSPWGILVSETEIVSVDDLR